ncbi:hypothetical protein FNF29_01236 [Cafeteria roenbergensis]|uniref:Deleted in lung and esophageal cancer protein 1 Ig-like domain-containing protein n=1 Tax=Cafeteria roenbergensis TaxID=33653 RepID=A0A5A8CTP5_CAFRO|nr:hypothetical protein FNF29_01236 [Cafeteria roenbergensis]|eukprot:KAA0156445.1 hypothetical protein FNF29_01236 [Cafeteria roenbergensis]
MVGSVGHILRSTFADLYGGAPPPGSKPVARAAQMSLDDGTGEGGALGFRAAGASEAAKDELEAIAGELEAARSAVQRVEAGLEETSRLVEAQDATTRAEARGRGLVLGSEVVIRPGLPGRRPRDIASQAGMRGVRLVSAADVVEAEARDYRVRTGNERAGRSAPDFFSSAAADGEGPGYLRATAASGTRMDASRSRFLGTTGAFGAATGQLGHPGGVGSSADKAGQGRRAKDGAGEARQTRQANAAAGDRMARPQQYLKNPRYLPGKGLRAERKSPRSEAAGDDFEFVCLGAGEGGLGWSSAAGGADASLDEPDDSVDGPVLDAGEPLETVPSVTHRRGALQDPDAERLAKTHTLRGVRAAPLVEGGAARRVGPFLAYPASVEFSGFVPGARYEATLTLRNADTLSRSLRVLPPATDRFTSEPPVYSSGATKGAPASGVLAPGMAVVVRVGFSPDSFADAEDALVVLTETGKFTIPLRAGDEAPRMDLPLEADAGLCLSGDSAVSRIEVRNTGAAGAFRLFPAEDWPPAEGTDPVVAASLVAPDAGEANAEEVAAARAAAPPALRSSACAYGPSPPRLVSPPFAVSPAYFRLARGGTATLLVRFAPPAPGVYERSFVLLSHRGDVTEHRLTGKCAGLSVGVTRVDGVALPDPELLPEAAAERQQRLRAAMAARLARVPPYTAPPSGTVGAAGGAVAGSRPDSPARSPVGSPPAPSSARAPAEADAGAESDSDAEALAARCEAPDSPSARLAAAAARRHRAEQAALSRAPAADPLGAVRLANLPLRLRFKDALVGDTESRTVTVRNDTPLALPFRWVVKPMPAFAPSIEVVDDGLPVDAGVSGTLSHHRSDDRDASGPAEGAGSPSLHRPGATAEDLTATARAAGTGLAAVGTLRKRPRKVKLLLQAGDGAAEPRELRFASMAEAASAISYHRLADADFAGAAAAAAVAGGAAAAAKARAAAPGADDDVDAPFAIEPRSGRIPAGAEVAFKVLFRPGAPGEDSAVARMLVEGVPVDDDEPRDALELPASQGAMRLPGGDSDLTVSEQLAALTPRSMASRAEAAAVLRRRVTVSTLALHGACSAPEAVLTPSVVVFPPGLLPGSSVTQAVTLRNTSSCPVWFEFGEPACMRRPAPSADWEPVGVLQPDPRPWHERVLRPRAGDADGAEGDEPAAAGASEGRRMPGDASVGADSDTEDGTGLGGGGRAPLFCVAPERGMIPPHGVASITAIVEASACGEVVCEAPCSVFFQGGTSARAGTLVSAPGQLPPAAVLTSRLSLRAIASIEAPKLRFTSPELDFGLLKVRTSAACSLRIQNLSAVPAPWRLSQVPAAAFVSAARAAELEAAPGQRCSLSFSPCEGVLPPFGEGDVSVSCTAGSAPHRLREMLQCDVPGSAGADPITLRVRGEVQRPLVFLDRHSVSLGIAFVGVPVRRVVRVTNLSNLTAAFRWDPAVGMRLASEAGADSPGPGSGSPRGGGGGDADDVDGERLLAAAADGRDSPTALALAAHASAERRAERALDALREENNAVRRPGSEPGSPTGSTSGGVVPAPRGAAAGLPEAGSPSPARQGRRRGKAARRALPVAPFDASVLPSRSGVLGEKESREFTLVVTPRMAVAKLSSLCALDVEGVPGPVGVALEGVVRPLTVAFAVVDDKGKPDADAAFERSLASLMDRVLAGKGLPRGREIEPHLAGAMPHAVFCNALRTQRAAVRDDPGAAGDATMALLERSLADAEAAGARVGRMPQVDFGKQLPTFSRRTFCVEVRNLSGVPTDFAVRVIKYPAFAGRLSAGPAGIDLTDEEAKALAAQDPSGMAEAERQRVARGIVPSDPQAEAAAAGAASARGRRDRGFLGLPFSDEPRGRSGSRAGSTPATGGAGATSRRPREWLGREHEDHSRFQSEEGKAELRRRRGLEIQQEQLCLLNGVAFQVWPRACHLAPFATARIMVSCVADMPGTYEDQLEILMDAAPPVKLPVRVTVVGSPLTVDPTTAGMRCTVFPPALAFGDLPDGAAPAAKLITVRNTAPLDAHIRWCLTVPRPPGAPEEPLRLSILGQDASPEGGGGQAAIVELAHGSDRRPAFPPPFSVEPVEAVVPAQSSATFRVSAVPLSRSEAEASADAALGWSDAKAGAAGGPRRGLLVADALWVPRGDEPDQGMLQELRDDEADDAIATATATSEAGTGGAGSEDGAEEGAQAGPSTPVPRRGAPADPGMQAAAVVRPRLVRESLRLGLLVNPIKPALDIDEEVGEGGIPWAALRVWATERPTHESYLRSLTLSNAFDLSLRFGVEVEGPFRLERVHTAAKPAPTAGADLTSTIRGLESRGVKVLALPPRANVVVDVRFDPRLVAAAAPSGLAASGAGGAGTKALAGTASLSKEARQAGVPQSKGALSTEHRGSLLLTFVNGEVQRVGLAAQVLRPKVIAAPPVTNFGVVRCGTPRVLRLVVGNPTVVPADWALRHVPAPAPRERVAINAGALGLKGTPGLGADDDAAGPSPAVVVDDPTVFGFSSHKGLLPGPTVDLEVAPRAAPLRESGAAPQPVTLGVRFAPKEPALYKCRFRVEVRGGQPFEVLLMGQGTHEEVA